MVALALVLGTGAVLVFGGRGGPAPFPGLSGRRSAPLELEEGLAQKALRGNRLAMRASDSTTLAATVAAGDALAEGWGRRVARRASLDLELADVDRGVARLVDLVESAGGFVAGTESHTDPSGTVGATLTGQVPPAAFARTLASVDGIGRVTARRVSGQDVSEEFVDLEARIRNLERHEGQLLGFMGKAQKVADLLSLEGELSRVRGEIEQASGRLRFLRARVDMATIQVVLTRTPAARPADGFAAARRQVRDAFEAGWRLAFGLTVAVVALAAQLSPFALALGAAWLLYRRLGSRRPAAMPPAAPAGS
jgi:hypothetical protein